MNIDDFHILFLTLILIFNPYLLRYFLAAPTMINDLAFINSGLLIILGIIDKKKSFFYFGFFIALITRQNSIFFLLSILIAKLIFKKKSLVNYKDIFFITILTLLIFTINTKFAAHHTIYNESYSLMMRLNLFTFDFTFLDFIKYNLFPMIILVPPFLYLICEKKKITFYKIEIELFLILLLMVLFTASVAYVGGPIVTGKNLTRLINLTYPLMILFTIMPFKLKKNQLSSLKSLFYTTIILIWSFHPTFSNIKILSFLKF